MAKISNSKIDKYIKMNSRDGIAFTIMEDNGKPVTVEINPSISFSMFGSMVTEMAELQFSGSGEYEAYYPYLYPFAKGYVFIKYFTNLDIGAQASKGKPDEKVVERVWNLYQYTPLMKEIERVIGEEFISEIENTVQTLVEERCIRIRPGAAKLWSDLDSLVSAWKNKIGDMSDNDTQMFIDLTKKMSSMDDKRIVELMR